MKIKFLLNHRYNNKIFIKNIETSTRDQANSETWFCERAKRITASNFGSVINRNQKIYPASLLKKLLPSKWKMVPVSCKWGKDNEKLAISEYEHLANLS